MREFFQGWRRKGGHAGDGVRCVYWMNAKLPCVRSDMRSHREQSTWADRDGRRSVVDVVGLLRTRS
jgi:hypothetical protein